ncbi:hypothetical protein FE392_06245 [Xenorhabdus sp. 12]|uniref:Uncharacterized protein n=1 Tax=Xenorhabdus santafensis TaxID=2582833 RepID=A0ABU4S822_9GAMM|nr:hypothetical protein [Xenorhabdus sp. 12]MDX7986931.1 hypothetical protein [Xenorhabdus sp. 12]
MMGRSFHDFYQQMDHYGDRPRPADYSNYTPQNHTSAAEVMLGSHPFSLSYFIDHSGGKANVLVLTSVLGCHDLLDASITPWMFYSNVREIILHEGLWITPDPELTQNNQGMNMDNKLDAVFVAVSFIASADRAHFADAYTVCIYNHFRQYLQYLADKLTVPVCAPQGEIRNRYHVTNRGTDFFCVRDYQLNQLDVFYPHEGAHPATNDFFWR